jgi:signal peptide peptidase SppA
MASRKKRRRLQAQSILSQVATEPWMMESSSLEALIQQVANIAGDGSLPEIQFNAGPKLYSDASNREQYSPKTRFVGSVAMIPIFGVIRPKTDFITRYFNATSCEDIQLDLRTALGDSSVDQIVFLVDSPGGSVYQVAETSRMIYEARGQKKITAFTIGMNASAAYFISSAADEIGASETASIGSVGAKIMHVDYSKAYAEFGIKVTELHYGENKINGSPYRPLDEKGRQDYQQVVDDYGQQFVDAVARNRGIDAAKVLKDYGQGSVFHANRALSKGLIDSVGPLELKSSKRRASATASSESLPIEQQSGSPLVVTSASSLNPIVTNNKPIEGIKVKKVNALLFGLGLIDSTEVDDATALGALRAYAAGKGVSAPINEAGEINESAAVSLLTGGSSAPVQGSGSAASTDSGTANNAAAVQAARDQEVAEAREAERNLIAQRTSDLRSIASLVNRTGVVVTSEMVDAAVSDVETSVDTFRAQWQKLLTEAPGASAVRIGIEQASEDAFAQQATLSLLSRSDEFRMSPEQRNVVRNSSLRNESLLTIAQKCIEFSGDRRSAAGLTPEETASFALAGVAPSRRMSWADQAAYNRPADFPNLMANLASMYMQSIAELARSTYRQWAQRLPSTNDFKYDTFVAHGSFTTLDDIPDGDEYEELDFKSELKGHIAVDRKGNAVKLTPVMVVNDGSGLDSFMQQLKTLFYAHENTLNEVCLNPIVNNAAVSGDGAVLFSTGRGNLISSGGQPSTTEAEKMRLLHRRMKGVGTDKPIRSRPNVVLCGPRHEDAMMQTYAPLGSLPEIKNPATDATINIYRGTVPSVVVEDELDLYESGYPWYTLDTNIRTIAYQFMSGYENGKRVSWYNPSNDSRYYGMEGRFAAALLGFRGIYKNPGQ